MTSKTTIMKKHKLIEKWKKTNMNNIIGSSYISKGMMAEVQGGVGNGYIHTLSGECNKSGISCWKIFKQIFEELAAPIS